MGVVMSVSTTKTPYNGGNRVKRYIGSKNNWHRIRGGTGNERLTRSECHTHPKMGGYFPSFFFFVNFIEKKRIKGGEKCSS
jgi:hypothetical protein